MGDLGFLGQLVNSMYEAVLKLENAEKKGKTADEDSLKKFILDMQKKMETELEGSDEF